MSKDDYWVLSTTVKIGDKDWFMGKNGYTCGKKRVCM